ncbi:biosynthetic arginine decarboxylase [bacterium]|nr:biosynthetic arginine decarboxylase [bacterium]
MLPAWGDGYFSVNEGGNIQVNAGENQSSRIDVVKVVDSLSQKGVTFPLLIRFQDVLMGRIRQLNEAFSNAIEEQAYLGTYTSVYPIKVNQLHEVVEELLEAGKPYGMGLECGSKAELIAALPLLEDNKTLLICNGYKDRPMLDLILTGQQIGKPVIPVIEKYDEFVSWNELAKKRKLDAPFGVRLRLTTAGAGKWADSGGDLSKFGISIPELLRVVEYLVEQEELERFQLLHFHLGSQISDIRTLKKAVREITQVYAQLLKRGLTIKYLDVGGGLGVNYGGGYNGSDDAINYSLQEYANAIVSTLKDVCDTEGVPHPIIISESGRALTAHHSVLVMNAIGLYGKDQIEADFKPNNKDHRIVMDQFETLNWLSADDEMEIPELLEAYHDAAGKRNEADTLFSLGYMPLEQKAIVEKLYWAICRKINAQVHRRDEDLLPPELEQLDSHLIDQCLCDFSVFQSLLDHWAIGQRFPIVPLQRLNERPTRRATLVDLTCDSDGKVSSYIGGNNFLEMHSIESGVPYRFCIFLMGAYQDIMGDTHNLFGRVTEAHVYADDEEPDGFYVEKILPGTPVKDMLALVQYFPNDLYSRMNKHIRAAIQNGSIKASAGYKLLERYAESFNQSTYYDQSKNV